MENIALCVHRPVIELMSSADVNTAEARYCKSQPEASLDYYVHILKLNLFFLHSSSVMLSFGRAEIGIFYINALSNMYWIHCVHVIWSVLYAKSHHVAETMFSMK